MSISTWDEIRTAYHVAQAGTVSGAAEMLGVHHATVIRHIDALEAQLCVRLFQRHARGYTPTEEGRDLLQVAQATDERFAQLVARIRGRGRGTEVTGELVVTSLNTASPRLTPALAKFRGLHPELVVRYLTGERLFRLEYGEAHVAIRAGPRPEDLDNVVQPFGTQRMGLYGSADYLARYPVPTDARNLEQHFFVALDEEKTRAPFERWLRDHVPQDRIVFRANDLQVLRDAVVAGVGLGFVSHWDAERFPTLQSVLSPLESWHAPLWLVTHVDLHRTTKVQTFLEFLKGEAESW